MKIYDEKASEYIKELETLNDLLQEEVYEWRERAKILEAQLAMLRQDRRYEVA